MFKRIATRCAALLLAAGICLADLAPFTFADITGDGSSHQIGVTGRAKEIQIVALTTNTAVVRIGDSNVSSTRGIPIAAGAGYHFPPQTNNQVYDLSKLFYFAASGDKLSITWVN